MRPAAGAGKGVSGQVGCKNGQGGPLARRPARQEAPAAGAVREHRETLLDDPGLAEVGSTVRPEVPRHGGQGTGLCLILNPRAARDCAPPELADQGRGSAHAGSFRFHPPPSAL